MYKVIFSDLDLTLLSDDKTISNKNKEAIKKAKEKGVKFLLCTGRLPFCYEMFKDDIDLSNAVSSNGSIIINDSKIIKDESLDSNIIGVLVEYAIKHHIYLRLFAIDCLYNLNSDQGDSDMISYFNMKDVNDGEARDIAKNMKLYKAAFFNKSHDYLINVKRDLEEMKLEIEAVFSYDTFLEINQKGQTKGKGVEEYCRLCGIDIKDTIAIGDNNNDASMLKVAGLAACPSNSIEEIKGIADYISPLNNNDGAVADIIEKYILNSEK